jgi:multidrug efflux system outer membrane protein
LRFLFYFTLPAILLLTGCMVGPNYQRPKVAVPQAFRSAATREQGQSPESIADLPWWQVFKDPVLQKLIRTGLERNYDVRLAAESIVAAREEVRATRANQLPQVSADPSYSGGKNPQNGTTVNTNTLSLLADVNYELDLFGGLRRATEASRASLLATEQARRTVLLTLVSDIATDYYDLLSLDLQLQISRDTVAAQQKSVKLTTSRVEYGVATKVDMLQAMQVLDSANAQIPDLERQIAREEDALSILMGNYPEAVPRGASLRDQELPPAMPTGITSALLERRPDIGKAEDNLKYYNAEIGVARAQFFPQISLTGSFGRSQIFTSLMSNAASVWTYTASATQPIFEGGKLRANLLIAESQQRSALLTYMQTVQKAFGDVSDAIVDYEKYRDQHAKEEQYVTDLKESLRLANMRYNGGTTNYLEVLDAQRNLFAQQLSLAQIRALQFQSVVQLYRALGGGWQQ